jgi:tRNA(adenine34) deaminase
MTEALTLNYAALALKQAQEAASRGEVPVGAAIISAEGQLIAADGNRTRERNDPTAHAEMLVIRAACKKLGLERLTSCDLYVTLEPCAMCAGAISQARLRRLYYAASDPKSGGVEQGARVFQHATCHHKPDVYAGLGEAEAAHLLRDFFSNKRPG